MNDSDSPRFDLPDGEYALDPKPMYTAQFASKNLVSDFLDGRLDPAKDPQWRAFGFSNPQEYAYWAPRLCGLICVKMVFDAFRIEHESPVSELTAEAASMGGYDRESDTGWFYAPLVEFAKAKGLNGQVDANMTLDVLGQHVINNHYVIASVHPGVIRGDYPSSPSGRKGGHLVVISGLGVEHGQVAQCVIQNPSGRTHETQEDARIDVEQFLEAFAGRGIVLWK